MASAHMHLLTAPHFRHGGVCLANPSAGNLEEYVEISPGHRPSTGGVGAVARQQAMRPDVNEILREPHVPVIDLTQIPPHSQNPGT
jgi:hypothetical protein